MGIVSEWVEHQPLGLRVTGSKPLDPLFGDPISKDPLLGDSLSGHPLFGDPRRGDPLYSDPSPRDLLLRDPLPGGPHLGEPSGRRGRASLACGDGAKRQLFLGA